MDQVKIGWARREISMEGPVVIPGQMHLRISQGILDPLCATVLVVDGGDDQDSVIFCSLDVIVISRGITEMISKLVLERCPEAPVGYIVMNATHTHSSMEYWVDREEAITGEPVLNGLKTVRPHIARQCADAICEAWENRAPGGISYGYGFAVVAHSRRVCYMDDVGLRSDNSVAPNGHAVMYGNTADPMFSHYEAGADHFTNLLFTFDGNEKLTGMIVNVPCPSQNSGNFSMLSADYWHNVRQLVAKEFGDDVYVLPQCAAAGDLAPRTLHYKQAQARRMELKYGLSYDLKNLRGQNTDNYNRSMAERYDIAQRIVDSVCEVYDWARKDIKTHVPVHHVSKTIALNRRMITEGEKVWAEENIEKMRQQIPDKTKGTVEEIRIATTRFESIRNRNLRAINRYENQKDEPTVDAQLHVVSIDDVAFSTSRFEVYQDFMHRLQARSPFLQTFVIQMGGDEESTYLATQRATENKGYSASLFCNQVSAEGGQQWVENTLAILKGFKEKDEV